MSDRDEKPSKTDILGELMRYAFWNNKGGTGKTSLAFQAICRYAEQHPDIRVLAVDGCPQANLSELFLGGLTGRGGQRLLERHGQPPRCGLGGYFQTRLPSPFNVPNFNAHDFVTTPSQYNHLVPANIDLICGDPMLELQANAINTLFEHPDPRHGHVGASNRLAQ
jgi:cellulose biosynthesis protein BcsQ